MSVRKDYLQRIDDLQGVLNNYESPKQLVLAARESRALNITESGIHRLQNQLNQLSTVHSTHLEIPEWTQTYDRRVGRKERKKIQEKEKKLTGRLQNTWKWLKTEYETPTEEIIQRIAAEVEPELHSSNIANYRTTNVRLLGIESLPLRWEKVPDEMKAVLEKTQQKDLHPVTVSSYLHFHLIRVQPFEDGNKRTARLIQSAHLHKNGLPPAIIESGSREFYNTLFERAHNEYKKRIAEEEEEQSREESLFFDFLAHRVLVSLETMIQTLERRQKQRK